MTHFNWSSSKTEQSFTALLFKWQSEISYYYFDVDVYVIPCFAFQSFIDSQNDLADRKLAHPGG